MGGGSIPLSGGCFKSELFKSTPIPGGGDDGDFVKHKIPFNFFSDKWRPSTGN